MSEVRKLKPFIEVVNEYIPHMDENPNWCESDEGGSLLLRAVIYLVTRHEVTPEDRELAKKALDILLESGVSPTYETPIGPNRSRISPLELVRLSDNTQLHDYILNKSLESPPSFESVAFENKFTDFMKGMGNIAANLAGNIVTGGAGIKSAVVNKILDKKEAKATQKIADRARAVADQEIRERGLDPGSEKNQEIIKKQQEAFDLIPDKISSLDKPLAIALAKQVAEEGGKNSKLLSAVNALSNTVEVKSSSNSVFWFLLDKKFGKPLVETLARHRAGGLGPDSETALKQMKVIAYWLDKNRNIDELRTSGRWRPLGGMERIVKNLSAGSGQIMDSNSASGKEILANLLKKKSLSSSDLVNYLSRSFFNNNSEDAENFFKSNRESILKILSTTFNKTLDDDNLVDLFNNSLSKLIQGPSLTKDQSQAIEILKNMGISGKEVLNEVRKNSGSVQNIILDILKKRGGGGI